MRATTYTVFSATQRAAVGKLLPPDRIEDYRELLGRRTIRRNAKVNFVARVSELEVGS